MGKDLEIRSQEKQIKELGMYITLGIHTTAVFKYLEGQHVGKELSHSLGSRRQQRSKINGCKSQEDELVFLIKKYFLVFRAVQHRGNLPYKQQSSHCQRCPSPGYCSKDWVKVQRIKSLRSFHIQAFSCRFALICATFILLSLSQVGTSKVEKSKEFPAVVNFSPDMSWETHS